MKTDAELQDDVVQELRWDPQVAEPDHIGVAVADGAVTLTGHTTTYAEKLAVARAAERVYGVRTVANDLQVRLAGSPRDDGDIAKAIAHVLEWNVQIPTGRVQARAQDGWVNLEGQVDHDFQRREVERMVRHVRGVVGITDAVSVTAPVSPVQVEAQIQDAFQREADVDARQVRVEVADHTAQLPNATGPERLSQHGAAGSVPQVTSAWVIHDWARTEPQTEGAGRAQCRAPWPHPPRLGRPQGHHLGGDPCPAP